MKLSFWLCVVGTVLVESFINYEKANLKTNPDYLVGNITIFRPIGEFPTLTIHAKVIKTVNIKIMLKVQVFVLIGKSRRPVLPFPSINYCDMISGRLIPMMTLQLMIDGMAKYGNLVSPCPIVPGEYYLKRYTMDETVSSVTRMMPEGVQFLTTFTLTDENSGKPELIASFQTWSSSNRSNWN